MQNAPGTLICLPEERQINVPGALKQFQSELAAASQTARRNDAFAASAVAQGRGCFRLCNAGKNACRQHVQLSACFHTSIVVIRKARGLANACRKHGGTFFVRGQETKGARRKR